MLLKFQIIFTILSALCVALILPIGTFLDWIWALICVFGAFIFFMLMRICKQARETQEENTPTESTPESLPNENIKTLESNKEETNE